MWQNEMTRIVRFLVNDLSSSPTYDDARLEETIAVAGQLTQTNFDFTNIYTIDVDTISISPDPTTNTKDDTFINLVCMQAAVIILAGELKESSLNSIRVSDASASIDYTDVVRNKKILYDDMSNKLAMAKVQYRAGNSIAGQAILTPYTYDNLYASYYPN